MDIKITQTVSVIVSPSPPPPPTKRLLTVSVSVNLLKFMRTILELVWTNIVYVSAMSRYLYSKDLRWRKKQQKSEPRVTGIHKGGRPIHAWGESILTSGPAEMFRKPSTEFRSPAKMVCVWLCLKYTTYTMHIKALSFQLGWQLN